MPTKNKTASPSAEEKSHLHSRLKPFVNEDIYSRGQSEECGVILKALGKPRLPVSNGWQG